MDNAVATFYFSGTLQTAAMWQNAWQQQQAHPANCELIATLFHYQQATLIDGKTNDDKQQYKAQFDGVGTDGGITGAFATAFSNTGIGRMTVGRNYQRIQAEVEQALILLKQTIKTQPIVLNLIGFSRGAVSAIRFAETLKNDAQIICINIIAIDPVRGELSETHTHFIDNWQGLLDKNITMNVSQKVANLVVFYAADERTLFFDAAIPNLTSKQTRYLPILLRGAHETLVGLTLRNGHSGVMQNTDNTYAGAGVQAVAWIVNYVIQTLLSAWTHVTYAADYPQVWQVDSAMLVDKINAMYAVDETLWQSMRLTAFGVAPIAGYDPAWYPHKGCLGLNFKAGLQAFAKLSNADNKRYKTAEQIADKSRCAFFQDQYYALTQWVKTCDAIALQQQLHHLMTPKTLDYKHN